MQLTILDWAIIVGYFLLTLAIGAYFSRRAGKSLAEFFVSGRSLPWWVAGTSMVATTFAADTPLAVTGLIVKNGLAGNWFWWAFAVGGMFTVFVYARLWRRAEVMTDVELIRIRYDGAAANGLRYIRAFYVSLIVNPIIIGWVIGAMLKVLQFTVFTDSPEAGGDTFWNQQFLPWATVIGVMVVVAIYSTMSGMWGVAVADVIQFCIAMVGCVWLAIVAVHHVGGVEQLQANVEESFGDRSAFDYLPALESTDSQGAANLDFGDGTATSIGSEAVRSTEEFVRRQKDGMSPAIASALVDLASKVQTAGMKLESDRTDKNERLFTDSVAQLKSSLVKAMPGPWMAVHIFLIMLTMQWWAAWYPGSEPGGGGYVVQRMASCKDERHSVLATLWYQIAYYCVRPWPWIMIAFVALAMYPELRVNYMTDDEFDPGVGFPMVMRELCTPGLAGLMLVAFFAAFMSTMSTQMNWGASYLVRDFVQPLFMKDASDRRLTKVSRIVSVAILGVGLVFGFFMQGISVDDAWKLLAALGAGTGLVFMLRWFWWRINAYSEIVAMVSSLVYFLLLSNIQVQSMLFGDHRLRSEEQMALVAGLTIVTWLVATFLTPPESRETLTAFFRKVRPGGPGWKPIAKESPDVQQDTDLGVSIFGAFAASGIVYLTLPAIGFVIFGKYTSAAGCLVGAIVCAAAVGWTLNRMQKSE